MAGKNFSNEELSGIIATKEICNDAKLKEKILLGADTPISECVDVKEAFTLGKQKSRQRAKNVGMKKADNEEAVTEIRKKKSDN